MTFTFNINTINIKLPVKKFTVNLRFPLKYIKNQLFFYLKHAQYIV